MLLSSKIVIFVNVTLSLWFKGKKSVLCCFYQDWFCSKDRSTNLVIFPMFNLIIMVRIKTGLECKKSFIFTVLNFLARVLVKRFDCDF